MTEQRTQFEAWVASYEDAWRDPSVVPAARCPSCGEASLRLMFVVEQMDAESGTAIFWCGSCLRGLMPTKAPVPNAGVAVIRGDEEMPNYRIVADDSPAS